MEQVNSRRILTVPNLLSAIRIVLIGVFAVFFLTAQTWRGYFGALCALALSGLTDLFDGKIARHFHSVSNFGKILDPIADKLTQGVVVLCLWRSHTYTYPYLRWLFFVLIAKEALQGFYGLYVNRRAGYNEGAKMCGKISTVYLFGLLIILLLFPNLPAGAAIPLIAVSIGLLLYALVDYLIIFHRFLRDAKSNPAAEPGTH